MDISIEKAAQDLRAVLDHVVAKNDPITVVGPTGRLVRIVPVPKPILYFKGHPVYRPEDLQYLGIPAYE